MAPSSDVCPDSTNCDRTTSVITLQCSSKHKDNFSVQFYFVSLIVKHVLCAVLCKAIPPYEWIPPGRLQSSQNLQKTCSFFFWAQLVDRQMILYSSRRSPANQPGVKISYTDSIVTNKLHYVSKNIRSPTNKIQKLLIAAKYYNCRCR